MMTINQMNRLLALDKFTMIYRGEFNDDLTFELMEIQSMGSGEKKSIRKRLSYLVAECFQNIIRHGVNEDEKEALANSPILISRNIEKQHFITTINTIVNDQIEPLKTMLDNLSELNHEEIEATFYKALDSNQISDKGGAGIGLIDMARKTQNKLEYRFEELNDSTSLFYLQLWLNAENSESANLPLSNSQHLYHLMDEKNVVLLRKGDFSEESILPIFNLFEANLKLSDKDLRIQKNSLYILIEMLQNINRHAYEIDGKHEGIFLVTLNDDGHYTLETGNLITSEKASNLERDLSELSQLDKIQLNKKYRDQLMSDEDSTNGAGIGLIEMFRNCEGKINYSFNKISEDLVYFGFGATLS